MLVCMGFLSTGILYSGEINTNGHPAFDKESFDWEDMGWYHGRGESSGESKGLDSLNMRFVGNWPFGDVYAVANDSVRSLSFCGSGGGVAVPYPLF